MQGSFWMMQFVARYSHAINIAANDTQHCFRPSVTFYPYQHQVQQILRPHTRSHTHHTHTPNPYYPSRTTPSHPCELKWCGHHINHACASAVLTTWQPQRSRRFPEILALPKGDKWRHYKEFIRFAPIHMEPRGSVYLPCDAQVPIRHCLHPFSLPNQ